MSKGLLGVAFLAVAVALPAAADPEAATSANGKGTIRFGHEDEGVGLFDFEVNIGGPQITGRLLFAAEQHDHFPDIIIRMEKIEKATVEGRQLTAAGGGWLHDDEVFVTVTAWDGSGIEDADRLHIEAQDTDGEEVFHAEGEVFIGDIVVGSDD